jgi:hypothetical protein
MNVKKAVYREASPLVAVGVLLWDVSVLTVTLPFD